MEPESSVTCSPETANCSYSEPDQSSSRASVLFFNEPFQYYPLIYPQIFQVASFLQVSAPKPSSSISTMSPARLIPLYLISILIFCEKYKPRSFSQCSFLHSGLLCSINVTTSLLVTRALSYESEVCLTIVKYLTQTTQLPQKDGENRIMKSLTICTYKSPNIIKVTKSRSITGAEVRNAYRCLVKNLE
jgi:hypothetical protein